MAEAPKDWKNSHGDRRGAAGFVNGVALAKYVPGLRKGKLVVVSVDRTNQKHPTYHLKCDCGEEFKTGAYLSEIDACTTCRPKKRIGAERKYGDRRINEERLYFSWTAMRHRCSSNNKRNKAWAGRGIKVCEEWEDFSVFEQWSLANGYRPGLSLDRINVDGNYEPSNCQWVSRSENSKRCRAEYVMVRKKPHRHFPIEMLWGAT